MKVDREKAYGASGGKMYTSWSARKLVGLVCDVLESQSHLWEREESHPNGGDVTIRAQYMARIADYMARIAELERELEFAARHRTELADANSELRVEIEAQRKARHDNDQRNARAALAYRKELNELRDYKQSAEAELANLLSETDRMRDYWDVEMAPVKERSEKAEAELERCSKACDEAKRKADDHRRQRDALERKSAEDAALIKSLQEQLAEAIEQRDLEADAKSDLAGAKEYAQRTAESCRKFLAERDEALAKLEKLRWVLFPRGGESSAGYESRVRYEAAEVMGVERLQGLK